MYKRQIQHPGALGALADDLGGNDFTHPTYRGVWDAVTGHGGPGAGVGHPSWGQQLRDAVSDPDVAGAISALGVEPLLTRRDPDQAYVAAHVYKLQELTALRRIALVKSKLQRTNPVDQAVDYNRMFGELVALEQHRRQLRDLAVGAS